MADQSQKMSSSITSREILSILAQACKAMPPDQLARASITGKREGLFRDILLNELAILFPHLLSRAEWNIPKTAVVKWKESQFAGDKSKGIIDLVSVAKSDPLAEVPEIVIEFKLWYWFDALNEAKYAEPKKSNHSLISASFLADVTKISSVTQMGVSNQFIVTVVPTFLTDRIESDLQVEPIAQLKKIGFPYSGLRFVTSSNSANDRTDALKKISDYFNEQGCPSIAGGDIRGSYLGVNVITDFVVSEIPRESLRSR